MSIIVVMIMHWRNHNVKMSSKFLTIMTMLTRMTIMIMMIIICQDFYWTSMHYTFSRLHWWYSLVWNLVDRKVFYRFTECFRSQLMIIKTSKLWRRVNVIFMNCWRCLCIWQVHRCNRIVFPQYEWKWKCISEVKKKLAF